jgi:hypothetical protein
MAVRDTHLQSMLAFLQHSSTYLKLLYVVFHAFDACICTFDVEAPDSGTGSS